MRLFGYKVEDFDVDMEIDTGKLDIFGTIITQVKMEGRVPASTHLVYDCSHGEWLLAQMAYDRKIRLFSSRCSPRESKCLLFRCTRTRIDCFWLRDASWYTGGGSIVNASNRPTGCLSGASSW